jgi:hypothetical protein
MDSILPLRRVPSPAPRPHSLAWDGTRFFLASIATKSIHALTPDFVEEYSIPCPGTPWGITWNGSELRALCGEGPGDDRFLRRLIPANGAAVDPAWSQPAPDDTGSQLSWDGATLYLSQWYRKQILALDPASPPGLAPIPQRIIPTPFGIAGHTIAKGHLYVIGTDAEQTTEFYFSRINLESLHCETLATVPFQARGLAFDGDHLWTCHREAHELVSFALP